MPLSRNDDRSRRADVAAALRRFQRHWTSGRRVVVPAGVIALIAAVAASALFASADEPGHRARPAAAARPTRTDVLLPIGALVKQGWLPNPTLNGDRGTVGVPTGTPSPPAAPNPRQLARQAPAIAPYQGSAGTLTPAGLATLALEQGCSRAAAVIAAAVAMAESGGSPSAQGDIGLMTSVWDWSAGLWQIRGLRSERNTGGLRDSVANQAVATNAAAMYTISSGCSNWTPWSTFDNGAYLQFVGLARQAVQYVLAYYAAHGHHYPPVPAPDPNATIPVRGPRDAAPARAEASRTRRAAATPGHRSTATRSASARPTSGQRTPTAAPLPSAAPTSPARRSSTSRPGRVPLPPPPTTPRVKLPTLPIPLPTTSLPLPLPTLH